MANVGTVQSVTGVVRAIAEDGTERILSVGDTVAENEKIITGDGVIVVAFNDGTVMDLGSNSSIVLNDDVLNQEGSGQTAQSRESAGEEVAALQEALTNPNFDPTADLPATAAGPTAAGGAGGANNGHSIVDVEYIDSRGEVLSGFETTGIQQVFSDVDDELPFVNGLPTAGTTTVLLDEDDLARFEGLAANFSELQDALSDFLGGNPVERARVAGVGDEAEGDDLPPEASTVLAGVLAANFGPDGPGGIVFNPAGTQPEVFSGGEEVQYFVSDDGHSLVGYIVTEQDYGSKGSRIKILQRDGEPEEFAEIIFTAEITDVATGAFRVALYGPVDHSDGSTEDNLLIDLGFTISDFDGDTAAGILRLDVDDDSPVIESREESNDDGQEIGYSGDYSIDDQVVRLDEDELSEGNHDDAPGDDEGGQYSHLTLPINFGADGPAEENPVVLSADGILDQNENPLTSNGVELEYVWNPDTNTLVGSANGEVIITLSVHVSEGGTHAGLDIELEGNLDHPIGALDATDDAPASPGTEDNLIFEIAYTATDFDGDSVPGTFKVDVDDDSPVIINPEASSVDEEGLPSGNAGDSYAEGSAEQITFANTIDVRIPVGSSSAGFTSSTIEVSGLASIADLDVLINLNHTYTADLLIYLVSPSGTRVELTTQSGGSSNNYNNTEFDDEATQNITDGSGPFTGTYRPEGDLSDFDGENPNGTWTLEITDQWGGDIGTLLNWELQFNGSLVGGDLPGEDTTASGSLGIQWGADDRDVDGTAAEHQEYDRSVTFDEQVAPADLTSNGLAVHYDVDGANIIAYTGTIDGDDYHEVFAVSISDDAEQGSYNFILRDNLDHSEAGVEDDIDLAFAFTATDSDGDSVSSNFTVTVDDDAPVIGTGEEAPESSIVDEDGLGNPGDSYTDGGDVAGEALASTGDLNISWGSDDNDNDIGGVAQAAADRSVAFDGATVAPAGLTSNGLAITYLVDSTGTLLTAYTGTIDADDYNEVFTVGLSDNGTGSYAFDLIDNLDHLGEGSVDTEDNIDLTFDFVVTDSDGDTANSSFTVTVDDDGPVVTGDGIVKIQLEEESVPSDQSGVIGNDEVDAPVDLSHTVSGNIDDNVSWGADGFGHVTNVVVSGGIYGVAENGSVTIYFDENGATDGTDGTFAVASLTVDYNGDYTFTVLDNLQHLDDDNNDENWLDILGTGFIQINAVDGDGDALIGGVKLDISINDDVPVVVADTNPNGVIFEDDTADITGNVLGNDNMGADGGEVITTSAMVQTYGTLTIAANGGYAFVLNNAAAQYLATDETVTQEFSYTVRDGDGDEATSTVTFTITGTNDNPEITVGDGDSDAGVLNETDAALVTTGTLTVGDVDLTDNVTASIDGLVVSGDSDRNDALAPNDAALLAMFTIDPAAILDGTETSETLTWDFNSGSEAFDYLAEGETLVLTYTVKATDDDSSLASDTQTVTVTIEGTNDQPTIAAVNANTALHLDRFTNDGQSATVSDNWGNSYSQMDSNTISNTRVEQLSDTEAQTVLTTAIGNYNDWDGVRIYLFEGEELVLTSNSGTKDYYLGIDDSDHSNGSSDPITGNFHWDALALTTDAGQSVSLTATNDGWYYIGTGSQSGVSSSGTYETIITINGTVVIYELHDAIEGDADLSTGDALTTFAGNLATAEDDDTTDTHTYNVVSGTASVTGAVTGLDVVVNSDGSYTVEGDFNALAAGQTAVVIFDYVANDGNGFDGTDGLNENSESAPATVTLTITGTNDRPVVENVNIGPIAETNGLQVIVNQGDLAATDEDAGATHSFSVFSGIVANDINGATTIPDLKLVLTDSGAGLYDVEGNFDHLAAGESVTLTFQYTADDGLGFDGTDGVNENSVSAPKTVTIVVEGTNDAPIITTGGTDLTFVSEAAGYNNVLGIYTFDANGNPENPQIVLTGTNDHSNYGLVSTLGLPLGSFGLFIIADGDDAYTDISTLTLGFDLSGTVPVLQINGADSTAPVYFDNNAWNTGGRDHFDTTINSDGSQTISIEDLDMGDNDRVDLVVNLKANVASVGGTVVEIADGAAGENIDLISTSGTLDFDDIDLSDSHTVQATAQGNNYLGSFTPTISQVATGTPEGEISWTFSVADILVDGMGADESITQVYTVTVDDGNGGTDTQDITITIQGTNDRPVALHDVVTSAIDENSAPVVINVMANDSDDDTNDLISIYRFDPTTTGGGTVSLNNAGKLVFNPGSDFDYLADGESVTVTFTYQIEDDSLYMTSGSTTAHNGISDNATVTLTVTGTNDAPETFVTSAQGTEDSMGIFVDLSGSDVDGTVEFFEISSLPANGVLMLGTAVLTVGSQVPATANAATVVFVPNENWNGDTTFTYASLDNDGLIDGSPAIATITVTAVNDPPVAVDDSANPTDDYLVDLGRIAQADEQYDWDGDYASWANADSNGQAVTITAVNFDGSDGSISRLASTDHRIGVDGAGSFSGVSEQIHHDEVTGDSQALVLDFEGYLNQATFSWTNLFKSEDGGEQGHWAAYLGDTLVGEGDFISASGNVDGTTISTGQVFNKIIFTAIETADATLGGSDDSSDYYLQSFQANGPDWANDPLITFEDNSIVVDSATILGNDSDPDGDNFAITWVSNEAVDGLGNVVGTVATTDIGGVITSVELTPNDNYSGEAKFDYKIVDEHGLESNVATVTIDVLPIADAPSLVMSMGEPTVTTVNATGYDVIDYKGDSYFVGGGGSGVVLKASTVSTHTTFDDVKGYGIGGGSGVDAIDKNESLMFDMKGDVSSATFNVSVDSSSLNAQWIAYDGNGTQVGQGDITSTGAIVVSGIGDFAYIAFDAANGASENDGGFYVLPTSSLGAADFMVNGSFEDLGNVDGNDDPLLGELTGTSLTHEDSIPGWQTIEGADMEPHAAGHAGVGTTDGQHYMDLGASPVGGGSVEGNTSIEQTFATLSAGQDYQLSFDYRDKAAMQESGADGRASGVMQVIWNGDVIDTISGDNVDAYERFSINVTATGNDSLVFAEIGDDDDNWGMAIDNVQLFGVTDYVDAPETTYTYDLSIAAALTDVDGSEILGDIIVDGDTVPNGVILKDSNGTVLVKNSEGDYVIDVTAADSDLGGSAVITVESDYELTADEINDIQGAVTSTDGSSTASTDDNVKVEADYIDFKALLDGNLFNSWGSNSNQDRAPSSDTTVTANVLALAGNSWRAVSLSQLGVAGDFDWSNGTLTFEAKVGAAGGELQGILFDHNTSQDNAIDTTNFIQVAGSQTWGTNAAFTSEDIGDDWVRVEVDLSLLDQSQGIFNNLVFVNDDDNAGNGTGEISFRNLSISDNAIDGQNLTDVLLEGTTGNDALYGGAGNDILIGGAGDDILIGDEGADLFIWNQGDVGTSGDPAHDTVTDFNISEDVLDLADLLSNPANGYSIEGTDNGSGDLQLNIGIADGNGDIAAVQEIELMGVSIAGDAEATLQSLLDTGVINDGI